MKLPRIPRQQRAEDPGEPGEEGQHVGVGHRARVALRSPFPVAADLRRAIDAPTMRDTLLPAVTGPQVADDSTVLRVLDLALRLGEVQLATGAGAAVAHDTMLAVATAYGLPVCDVDIAFSTITMCCHRGTEVGPVTTMRNVRYRTQDYTRLATVDDLLKDIVDSGSPISITEAFERLGQAADGPHPYPRFVAGLSRSLFAAAVAVLIGGGVTAALVSFVVTGVVWGLGRWLGRRRVPMFFQQVVGAGIVAATATGLAWAGVLDESPSLIIATGLVVLLSGLTLVGLVQDAITGFPLTAAGRVVEVVLSSAGLFIGVAAAIKAVQAIGGPTALAYAVAVPSGPPAGLEPQQLVSAAAAGIFFALSAYAPLRSLPVAAASGLLAWGEYAALVGSGVNQALSAALAAATLGLVAILLPDRLRIPPLVLVIAGITPLLPGLQLYRGFTQIALNSVSPGAVTTIVALTVALALAAGVSLGEQVGWPVHRTVRRLYAKRRGVTVPPTSDRARIF
jgi:uncharacterized membrane protein YjjP (DUF1212 family)